MKGIKKKYKNLGQVMVYVELGPEIAKQMRRNGLKSHQTMRQLQPSF
ncbi:hypothetical protein KKC_00317 [Listeria fleischmannii subsp. coloradonensis]|nr:hypothetical protein KKC_00317 [Listeria fleischmannii subsp. coloradonensis]